MKTWSAVALLFVCASVAAAAPTQCGLNDKLVTLSFDHALTEGEATAFLARHRLEASSAFLWVGGAPIAVSIAPGNAVASLRSLTETQLLANRPSIVAQAASFVAQHSRGELVRDPELAEQGKDILRQVTREDAVVQRSRANKPLVWALSVCAAPDALAAIGSEEGVQVSDDAQPLRPEQLSSRYPTPKIDPLSGAEVYEALVKLAKS